MQLGAHSELKHQLDDDQRDIAIVCAPGMGLTTLLADVKLMTNKAVVYVRPALIVDFWNREYKERETNKRFVIHAAALSSLFQNGLLHGTLTEADFFKSNLRLGLTNYGFDTRRGALVVIDDFDEMPLDLARIVLNELKAIDDQRSQPGFEVFNGVRFIIGGSIDFFEIYGNANPSGVSPATNFCKCPSHTLLLSAQESLDAVTNHHRNLRKVQRQMVVEWCGGHFHYLMEFSKWIEGITEVAPDITLQEMMTQLVEMIKENERIPLFRYCHDAWQKVAGDSSALTLLATMVSAGRVRDSTGLGRKLANLGLVIERAGQKGMFYPTNRFVELFLRQRLAEIQQVLPMEENVLTALPSLNAEAAQLVREIENRLRIFIGDKLYGKYRSDWAVAGFTDVVSSDGASLLEKVNERQAQAQTEVFQPAGMNDPYLSFLDLGDLVPIVTKRTDVFKGQYAEFASELPHIVNELNYYRRRVAHNRTITMEQVNALDNLWQQLQNLMSKPG